MKLLIFALCTVLCSRVLGHPYTSETTSWISATTTSVEDLWAVSEPTAVAHLYGKRGYDEILQARDTTTTTDSTTSTDATTDTTTSETSTSTTTSTTATSTSETSTSTSSTSTTSTSATSTSTTSTSATSTSTSTSTSSSSTTTSSASTTTSTATATATSSSTAALDEWNRRGNIAAIVFGCCMISLFGGLSFLYYARNRARARRIAARKELDSSPSCSTIPLVAAKHNSTTDIEIDRSSMMFTNKPETEYFPAESVPSLSNYHSHSHNNSTTSQTTAGQSSTRGHTPRAYSNEQNTPLVSNF